VSSWWWGRQQQHLVLLSGLQSGAHCSRRCLPFSRANVNQSHIKVNSATSCSGEVSLMAVCVCVCVWAPVWVKAFSCGHRQPCDAVTSGRREHPTAAAYSTAVLTSSGGPGCKMLCVVGCNAMLHCCSWVMLINLHAHYVGAMHLQSVLNPVDLITLPLLPPPTTSRTGMQLCLPLVPIVS
jgi:hypothetical protein